MMSAGQHFSLCKKKMPGHAVQFPRPGSQGGEQLPLPLKARGSNVNFIKDKRNLQQSASAGGLRCKNGPLVRMQRRHSTGNASSLIEESSNMHSLVKRSQGLSSCDILKSKINFDVIYDPPPTLSNIPQWHQDLQKSRSVVRLPALGPVAAALKGETSPQSSTECSTTCSPKSNSSSPLAGIMQRRHSTGNMKSLFNGSDVCSNMPTSPKHSEGLSSSDDEEESLADSFVVKHAPTIGEAVQRFQRSRFSDGEYSRMLTAYRRFTDGEDDLDKDCLDLVVSHLGFILTSEEDMKGVAKSAGARTSLDFDDLTTFLQGHAAGQKSIHAKAFNKEAHKQGNSGFTISLDEIASVMKELKIIVLGENLKELIERSGIENNLDASCDEVARIIAAYRVCEGFTVDQLKDAQEKFEEAAEEQTNGQRAIAIADLPNALLDLFGVHCVNHLRALVKIAGDALNYSGPLVHPVFFHEYLVWARQLKNAELLQLREHFDDAARDESSVISFEGLMAVMRKQGFTLNQPESHEFVEDAELPMEEGASFSFDDAYAYLTACRENDGFSRQDLAELKAAFAQFDTDGESELTTFQVLDLLRFMGYTVSVEDVERYANEVDFNGNGTMDVDEYLSLMRLHREDDLANVLKIFCLRAGGQEGRLPVETLHAALIEAQCCSPHCDVFDDICQGAIGELTVDLSFDEFRVLANKGRKVVMGAQRKKANFSDAEFKVLQGVFQKYDADGSGVLGQTQLLMLLHNCGMPMQKASQKRQAIEMLDSARTAALNAGISAEDVGEFGTSSATFCTMVHAWRIIARSNEPENVARVEKTRLACSLSLSEVEEFQKVYAQHVKQPLDPDSDSDSDAEEPEEALASSSGCKANRRLNAARNACPEPDTILEGILGMNPINEMLNFENFKKLLGNVSLEMGKAAADSLEKEMLALTGSTEGPLDFANFLSMMKWMLDTDFAHLNHLAATAAKRSVSE